MTSIGLDQRLIAAATTGDAAVFSALVERHRAELQVHAYRMSARSRTPRTPSRTPSSRLAQPRDG